MTIHLSTVFRSVVQAAEDKQLLPSANRTMSETAMQPPASGVDTAEGALAVDAADKLAGRNRWIQAGLALKETTSVVAEYAENVFKQAHENVLVKFPHVSSDGPTLHARKCNKVDESDNKTKHSSRAGGYLGCDVCISVTSSKQRQELADAFSALHRSDPPTIPPYGWPNARANLWDKPGHHIEMAKLFCNALGSHNDAIDKREFKELDGTALFNMIRWCTAFEESLIDPSDAATKARNLWAHEGAAKLSLSVRHLLPKYTRFVHVLH